MKLAIFTLVLCISLLTNAQSVWTQLESCPAEGRYRAVAQGFNGIGYAGLGRPGFFATTNLADFWAYDPQTDSWTQKADFPGGVREGAAAFATESRLFVGFGTSFIQFTNDLWEYLPGEDAWVQMPNVPGIGFAYSKGFVLGDMLYIGPENGTNKMYAFDTSTDTWSEKAPFPGQDRRAQATFALNGKGYIGAGLFVFGGSLSDWWAYDAASNTWEEVTNTMPATDQSSATATDSQGYFFNVGGCSSGCQDLYRFDPEQNTFVFDSTKPLERIANGSMMTIDNVPYLIFGELTVSGGNTPSNQLWRITPGSSLGSEELDLPSIPGVVHYLHNGGMRLQLSNPLTAAGSLTITDISGRTIAEIPLNIGTSEVADLGKYMPAAGLYLLNLESAGLRGVYKAVKQY